MLHYACDFTIDSHIVTFIGFLFYAGHYTNTTDALDN